MSCCASTVLPESSDNAVYSNVKEYYGKVLKSNQDLKTSACCSGDRPHKAITEALKLIPDEILNKFYGCGTPIPLGIEGLKVLDLGSGSGRDCYIASKLVGPSGFVTGVDMTVEQVSVANSYIESFTKEMGYPAPNMKFIQGYIEHLDEAGIQPNSMDLVISNCVVNLSPDKPRVIEQVFKALKVGGEFYFSDVYCDRRLPENVKQDKMLWGECLSGAMYLQDFIRLCHISGFTDPRILSTTPITVQDNLREVLGEAQFFSITFRLFKLPNLETLCEDYGQCVRYKGTIEGHNSSYTLDNHHKFVSGKVALVCGNTASMLQETWLSPHFTVIGDRSVHYGLFDCGGGGGSSSSSADNSSSPTCCM